MDRHFVYNELIKLYYKQRKERADAIEKTIKYCKEDILYLEDFLKAWKNEERRLGKKKIEYPRIPCLKRLAIIYEKQGEYEEAISICRLAMQYGLNDGTKEGFEGRMKRLKKKMGD